MNPPDLSGIRAVPEKHGVNGTPISFSSPAEPVSGQQSRSPGLFKPLPKSADQLNGSSLAATPELSRDELARQIRAKFESLVRASPSPQGLMTIPETTPLIHKQATGFQPSAHTPRAQLQDPLLARLLGRSSAENGQLKNGSWRTQQTPAVGGFQVPSARITLAATPTPHTGADMGAATISPGALPPRLDQPVASGAAAADSRGADRKESSLSPRVEAPAAARGSRGSPFHRSSSTGLRLQSPSEAKSQAILDKFPAFKPEGQLFSPLVPGRGALSRADSEETELSDDERESEYCPETTSPHGRLLQNGRPGQPMQRQSLAAAVRQVEADRLRLGRQQPKKDHGSSSNVDFPAPTARSLDRLDGRGPSRRSQEKPESYPLAGKAHASPGAPLASDVAPERREEPVDSGPQISVSELVGKGRTGDLRDRALAANSEGELGMLGVEAIIHDFDVRHQSHATAASSEEKQPLRSPRAATGAVDQPPTPETEPKGPPPQSLLPRVGLLEDRLGVPVSESSGEPNARNSTQDGAKPGATQITSPVRLSAWEPIEHSGESSDDVRRDTAAPGAEAVKQPGNLEAPTVSGQEPMVSEGCGSGDSDWECRNPQTSSRRPTRFKPVSPEPRAASHSADPECQEADFRTPLGRWKVTKRRSGSGWPEPTTSTGEMERTSERRRVTRQATRAAEESPLDMLARAVLSNSADPGSSKAVVDKSASANLRPVRGEKQPARQASTRVLQDSADASIHSRRKQSTVPSSREKCRVDTGQRIHQPSIPSAELPIDQPSEDAVLDTNLRQEGPGNEAEIGDAVLASRFLGGSGDGAAAEGLKPEFKSKGIQEDPNRENQAAAINGEDAGLKEDEEADMADIGYSDEVFDFEAAQPSPEEEGRPDQKEKSPPKASGISTSKAANRQPSARRSQRGMASKSAADSSAFEIEESAERPAAVKEKQKPSLAKQKDQSGLAMGTDEPSDTSDSLGDDSAQGDPDFVGGEEPQAGPEGGEGADAALMTKQEDKATNRAKNAAVRVKKEQLIIPSHLQVSRARRIRAPPVAFWANQRLRVDPKSGAVAVHNQFADQLTFGAASQLPRLLGKVKQEPLTKIKEEENVKKAAGKVKKAVSGASRRPAPLRRQTGNAPKPERSKRAPQAAAAGRKALKSAKPSQAGRPVQEPEGSLELRKGRKSLADVAVEAGIAAATRSDAKQAAGNRVAGKAASRPQAQREQPGNPLLNSDTEPLTQQRAVPQKKAQAQQIKPLNLESGRGHVRKKSRLNQATFPDDSEPSAASRPAERKRGRAADSQSAPAAKRQKPAHQKAQASKQASKEKAPLAAAQNNNKAAGKAESSLQKRPGRVASAAAAKRTKKPASEPSCSEHSDSQGTDDSEAEKTTLEQSGGRDGVKGGKTLTEGTRTEQGSGADDSAGDRQEGPEEDEVSNSSSDGSEAEEAGDEEDLEDDGWTQKQLAALKAAWLRDINPTASGFWSRVAQRVPGNKTAAECRDKHMAQFGDSPAPKQLKPKAPAKPPAAAAARTAGAATKKPTKVQARKMAREARWEERIGDDSPFSREEARQRQSKTDRYLDALLRRPGSKGRATAGFGSSLPAWQPQAAGRGQDLAGQVVSMIAATGGSPQESDEDEEKDDYFSDE